MNVPLAESCPNVREPRATALAIDPNDSRIVWAGIEVDGVRRSLDGGDTWTAIGATAMGEADIGEGIWDPDIHDIVVSRGTPSLVITSTPKEIFTSTDLGESWSPLKVKDHFATMYCRPMALKENDSNMLFVGNGDGPFGDTGSIQRSKDQGQTWETCDLPVEPNTGIWRFATHASDPKHGLRLQPFRPGLRQLRWRRQLEEAEAGLRRDLDDGGDAEISFGATAS